MNIHFSWNIYKSSNKNEHFVHLYFGEKFLWYKLEEYIL